MPRACSATARAPSSPSGTWSPMRASTASSTSPVRRPAVDRRRTAAGRSRAHRPSRRRRRPRRARRRAAGVGDDADRPAAAGVPRLAELIDEALMAGNLHPARPGADRRARPAPRHRPEVGPADRLPPAEGAGRRRRPGWPSRSPRPRPGCASAPAASTSPRATLCPICLDDRRDSSMICVVEESRDIVAIEKTGEFHGRYHVLLGAMSPLEGIGPEQLKIRSCSLASSRRASRRSSCAPTRTPRARSPRCTSPGCSSRSGSSSPASPAAFPVGGDLEYADELTLGRALEGRRAV